MSEGFSNRSEFAEYLSTAEARPVKVFTVSFPRLNLKTSYAVRRSDRSVPHTEKQLWVTRLTDKHQVHYQLYSIHLEPVILTLQSLQFCLINLRVTWGRFGRRASHGIGKQA